MRKVLFIAFYYNHNNEIASKRLQGVAKYLSAYNWVPIVLVPKIEGINSQKSNIKIVETDYVDMLDKFLPSKSNSQDNSKVSSNSNSSSIMSKLFSKAVSIAGEIFAFPDGMKYWYEPAFNSACQVIEDENIDAIISSSFPITAHVIAHDLKNKYNIPWIADLRDLWNLNPYINHNFIRNHFELNLEKKTFSNVDVLTTTTQKAAETLKTLHPQSKIVPVYSGYDPDEFKHVETIKRDDKLTFMYAGSLYGGKRDPSILFDAVRQLIDEGKVEGSKISINFYGDKDNLVELVNSYNLEDIVNINGKIPYEDVLKREKSSDVLLLISWMNPKEKMFIPGKVYEYLAFKKPVLSLGYKEGSLKDLINETNIGHHTSNLEDTKKVFYSFYKEYIETGKVSYCGNENASKYSMVETARSFASILDEELK
ncbi:hypothetical protein MBBWO_07210 [Methanobrevibacter woesei]|uniref:Glycosyltransferase subfamily 4-like N-terminal domain-containing protein n=1 Tax=Methanobrevibacter woesei TaxID=190976 RepID=A0A2U1S711_9EURY|nr:glycosyltransferase [Methanobrevibacter woesei]MCC9261705.1 glycosyltransferase [Methanobrevibacter woesei]PWB85875.1 hypothetical protein MBBWO_07210 [Methanobrevibacter woesei]